MKKNIYIKIFFIIFVSFFISDLLINNLFIAKSPILRSDLDIISKIKNQLNNNFLVKIFNINSIYQKKENNFKKIKDNNIEERLKNIPFNKISKGIYGKSDSKEAFIKIDISEIEFVEYSFNINGRQIKIKVPKDTSPPSEEFVKLLISK